MMDLAKLKELAQSATPGTWEAEALDKCGYGWVSASEGGLSTFGKPIQILRGQYRKQGDDARYVEAAQPKEILSLISRMEELEKHAEALADALAELRSLPAISLNDFEKSGRALFPYLDFHDKKEGA